MLFIIEYHNSHGYSPTFREIGKGVYLSNVSNIQKYIFILSEKGYLKYDYGIARSIVVLANTRGLKIERHVIPV